MKAVTKEQLLESARRGEELTMQFAEAAQGDIEALKAGKAAGNHTHIPSSIGAAEARHTHTAADVGARPATWTPTAADVGAAPANHTHTASEVGAAAASHSHTPSSIGAAAASHTHSNYVPTARKVNNKALSGDVNLSSSDVGAMPAIPGVAMSYDAATKTLTIKEAS